MNGEFQGVMTPITPTGIRRAMLWRPASAVEVSTPSGWLPSAAASSTSRADIWTSHPAFALIEPVSRTI
jgi:hypothetical protein